jgi:hypothetical protein
LTEALSRVLQLLSMQHERAIKELKEKQELEMDALRNKGEMANL